MCDFIGAKLRLVAARRMRIMAAVAFMTVVCCIQLRITALDGICKIELFVAIRTFYGRFGGNWCGAAGSCIA